MEQKSNKTSAGKVKQRLAALCARSEQCEFEIRRKLEHTQLSSEEKEDIIATLKKDKFIDDQRFAIAFANDKARHSGWGKFKIRQGLAWKRIAQPYIEEALSGLDEEEMSHMAEKLCMSKIRLSGLDLSNPADYRHVVRFLLGKGYSMPEAVAAARQCRMKIEKT